MIWWNVTVDVFLIRQYHIWFYISQEYVTWIYSYWIATWQRLNKLGTVGSGGMIGWWSNFASTRFSYRQRWETGRSWYVGLRLGDSYNPPLGDSIPYWTAIELQRERERRREGQKLGTAKKLRQRSFLLVVHTAWFAQRGSIVLEGMKKREREYLPWFRLVDGWRCIQIRWRK